MKVRLNIIILVVFVLVLTMVIPLAGCFNISISPKTTGAPPSITPPVTSSPPATTPATIPPSTISAPPVISQFVALPDTITPGGTATLSWLVSNATTVSIDNGIGGVGLSGSRSVFPASPTLYTLTAMGEGGTNMASAMVMVTYSPAADLPVINSFIASPATILKGNSAILSWSVANATSVEINQGIGAVAAAGSKTVSPTSSITYTLQATNAYGWRQQSISVTVNNIMQLNPQLTAIVMLKPDLVVEYLNWTALYLKFRVKNNGLVSAAASRAQLLSGGVSKSIVNVPLLLSGASSPEYSWGPFLCAIPNPVTIMVKVDIDNAVTESSEANNTYSKTYCQ